MSREEVARRELGHTAVSRSTVRMLLAFFLTAIAAVPMAEVIGVRVVRIDGDTSGTPSGAPSAAAALGTPSAWSHLIGLPAAVTAPPPGGLWDRLVSRNRIVLAGLSGFERGLENESLLGRSLRPRAQIVMTGSLGAGNERVYPGRDGWLFYRQDVEYVTGRGFLDPAQIRRRIDTAVEWEAPPQPDPRDAIEPFAADLAAREIALVVMPTPIKSGVHPEMLAERGDAVTGVLQNPSYAAFIDGLRRDGVLVFDASAALAAARRGGPQYLMTDTHWRPEAMELVADLLSGFITTHVMLPAAADPLYRIERFEVRNTGDIARMLDLAADQTLFPPEAVWLRRVLQPDGSPWRPARDADVLVLGDSFSNIYALESMRWGTSAGLVEQLSYAMRRPVDRLVQNDAGAFATRALLRRDPSRLDGKRVVVYQFAVRELAFGDWKPISFAPPDPR